MDDRHYMQMALDLARRGEGCTSPNPMVGAVVVADGRVVGQGYHQAVGGPHAEVHAIDAAGDAARGGTLYVTLEPCNHVGRTPPCTRKILDAGLRRVVAAMADPNPDVTGGGLRFLKAAGLQVEVGLLESEARRLNESFVKFVQTRRPFVMLKCAATLDGRLATRSGDSRWVTGAAAREQVHRLRHAVDAILVGVETVKRDDPSLTARLPSGGGRDPLRIVLDTHLSTPPGARMLRLKSTAATLLVAGDGQSDAAFEARRRRLVAASAQVLSLPLKDGRIDLQALVARLGSMGVASLLIEGGGRVIASALAAGIVDKVLFFFAPKILGGDDGVPICSGPGPERMRDCIPVSDMVVKRYGDDWLFEGYMRSCLPES